MQMPLLMLVNSRLAGASFSSTALVTLVSKLPVSTVFLASITPIIIILIAFISGSSSGGPFAPRCSSKRCRRAGGASPLPTPPPRTGSLTAPRPTPSRSMPTAISSPMSKSPTWQRASFSFLVNSCLVAIAGLASSMGSSTASSDLTPWIFLALGDLDFASRVAAQVSRSAHNGLLTPPW